MKTGMNLVLWTANVTRELFRPFPKLKAAGYEGIGVPVTRANDPVYGEIRNNLDDVGLACNTMFNLGADKNPISPDKAVLHDEGWLDPIFPPKPSSPPRRL